MVKTKDILALINGAAPFQIAEDWDNCGLQVGDLNQDAGHILIGLDAGLNIVKEAQKLGAGLVVTHHPLIMQPVKTIDFSDLTGAIVRCCAKHNISIISVHTNLDKAVNGLNDFFAEKIGIPATDVFLPDTPGPAENPVYSGIGRIGNLGAPVTLSLLAERIRKALDLPHVRITGRSDLKINRAVICTGSGGSLLDRFLESDAQVYITGDMKYHDARQVEDAGRALIDVGHFGSEQIAVELLHQMLTKASDEAGLSLKIESYKKEKDPFTIV